MFDRFWGRGNNLQATREATAYLFKNHLYMGLQPTQKWKPLYYIYSVFINTCVFIWLPVSLTLSYFYEFSRMTTIQFLTSLQVVTNIWGIPLKVLTRMLFLKHQHQALDIMDALDVRCLRQDEQKTIRSCAIIGNRMALLYMGFYVLYSTVTMISSVSMGHPPYTVFMPIMDWQNSTVDFIAQSSIEYIIMNLACLHQAGNDVYAVIYVYIIRTHMQILVERVSRLGADGKTSNDKHFEELILCIKDHQNLLSLVEMISPLISITFFMQFLITAVILGTTLINILIFADLSAQIASVVYLIAVLMQTFPCCYYATCLIEDSEQLSLAIFHCEWFDKDKRFRKMLIFFLMRSQTPITLTAMKLFPINVSTSVAIAKFSFSLYTFIKQMDFGQNF